MTAAPSDERTLLAFALLSTGDWAEDLLGLHCFGLLP